MEFEVGKEYKRRDGNISRLVAHVPDATHSQRLLWICGKYIHATGEDGSLLSGEVSGTDILPPEPEKVMVQKLVSSSGTVWEAIVGSEGERVLLAAAFKKLGQPYEVK